MQALCKRHDTIELHTAVGKSLDVLNHWIVCRAAAVLLALLVSYQESGMCITGRLFPDAHPCPSTMTHNRASAITQQTGI